jgi:hypothetical protein
MIHPQEFIVTNKERKVCYLNKALYGLKQAPHLLKGSKHGKVNQRIILQHKWNVVIK